MAHKVFVDGSEGTTGLRIHEVLARRRDIELLQIDPARRKDAAERARLLNAADVAFLCLPDAAAREAAFLVTSEKTCVIDASTAHRTAEGWTYGLPELAAGQREALRRSRRVANPGCHASAFILLLRPLVDAGLVPPTLPLAPTSITGYSGGGKKMIAEYESAGAGQSMPAALRAPRPYALTLAHKHLPEMMAHTGLVARPLFVPIVGPYLQGLAVTVPLHLSQLRPGTTAATLHAALAERYDGERFVRVMPLSDPDTLEAGAFDVQANNGSNAADLFVFAGEGQALLVARLDNLGKGASGAAVQSMNVHLGVDEGLGLS